MNVTLNYKATPQETIKIGPDNWTAAVPLLLIAYRDATPQGKKQAEQEIKNTAKVADLVPDLVAELEHIVERINTVVLRPGADKFTAGFSQALRDGANEALSKIKK